MKSVWTYLSRTQSQRRIARSLLIFGMLFLAWTRIEAKIIDTKTDQDYLVVKKAALEYAVVLDSSYTLKDVSFEGSVITVGFRRHVLEGSIKIELESTLKVKSAEVVGSSVVVVLDEEPRDENIVWKVTSVVSWAFSIVLIVLMIGIVF